MSDLNRVMIIGRLGKDPEIKYTPSGSAVANLSVATSEKWKDKETGESKEKTEWHRVVFFQRKAEVAGEYLKKGSQVFIEGKLQTRKWTDKDGQDRYSTEVVGENFQMLGGKTGDKQEPSQPKSGGFRDEPPAVADDLEDDDIPF